MRLTELIAPAGPGGPADVEISGLTADSREVRPGYLFAALKGEKSDGADFIAEALRRGASAILASPGAVADAGGTGAAVIADDNPRRRLAFLAARFYAPQPEVTVAVTGTNGKSSVVDFARQIWQALGFKAGSLGTLGAIGTGFRSAVANTTPDPVMLHRRLAEFAAAGLQHVAIEASSHGLVQHRLDAVALKAAAFTSFGRDHMDYHPTAEAYLAAKLRLFEQVLPPGGVAVAEGSLAVLPAIAAAVRSRGQMLLTYGLKGREIRLDRAVPGERGQHLSLTLWGRKHEVDLPLVGGFQALNALCALALVVASAGEAERDAVAAASVAALSGLKGVPGRMQEVARLAHGAPVLVDYAHTPDALQAALEALRPHVANRLVVVFGCGGDRDRGKRPLMGRLAASLADRAIVTDDNPRHEAAAEIRRAILAAAPGAEEIADRAAAIQAAVQGLGPGDLLLIAGKGHEQGQIVGNEIRPFDDAAVARAAIAGMAAGGAAAGGAA